MLVPSLAVLLCSGVLAAEALNLPALENPYDSTVEYTQQIPFGASRVLNQEDDRLVFDVAQIPQRAEGKTIYQILSDNPEFSRLVKIININDQVISLLNDSSVDITFFAPPNRALRPPHGHKHHRASLSLDDPAPLLEAYASYDLPQVIAEIEELETHLDPDKDKKRRKEIIKILVKAILYYHIIPKAIDVESLTHNTTYATNLVVPDNALDNQALRVRVSTKILPPSVQINFFSTVVKPNIGAKNGVIHVINHPLLPPLSVFQEIFLAPRMFGAVTSGLQRVSLTDAVEWRYVLEKGSDNKWKVEGTGSATFFVPSNLAFKKLPWKLELFLFSPFGENVLKKLLQFHVVPGIVLHSDYLHNATSGKTVSAGAWPDVYDEHHAEYSEESPLESEFGEEVERLPPPRPVGPPRGSRGPYGGGRRPREGDHHTPCKERASLRKPVFSANVTLPTLLTNHSLHVHVEKVKHRLPIPGHKKDIYTTKLFVNHQSVAVPDVVSRNGAVHIINKVLDPRPRHHHRLQKDDKGGPGVTNQEDNVWEDWEDWLPQWAAEN